MNTATTQPAFAISASGVASRYGSSVSAISGTVDCSRGALTGFIVEVGRVGKPYISGVVAILSTLISGILNLFLLIR